MTNREEAVAIRRALSDPTARTTVIVIGILLALPSDRARARVMTLVRDTLDEEAK